MNLFENLQMMKESNSDNHDYNGKSYWSIEDMYDLYELTSDKINKINKDDRMKLFKEFKKYDHTVSFMPKYTIGLKLDNYPSDLNELIKEPEQNTFLDEDDCWDVIEDLININEYLDNVNIDELIMPELSKSINKNNIEIKSLEDLAKYLKMTHKNVTKQLAMDGLYVTIHSLYSKDKMAYGNSFPYDNLFTIVDNSFIKKIKEYTKYKFYNKIWEYNKDSDIILVSMRGFNFITKKDDLLLDFESSDHYDPNNFIWDGKSKVPNDIINVMIQDGVNKIEDNAFQNRYSLQSIKIPNSVTEIGDKAFWRCDSLQSIEIPNSITKIGDEAFAFCDSLKSIKIPSSVTEIGKNAFCFFDYLQSIIIGNETMTLDEFNEKYNQ